MAFSGVGGNVVKHILPTFAEAANMVDDQFSSFVRKTSTRHITLPPKYLGRLKAGVNDIINADLGLYSDRLGGVMIAFSNMKMHHPTGTIMDDQSFIHFDIQLDEIIFKPTIGCWLQGVVNKKGENYIGCLVHGCFNASIPKPKHQINGWKGFDLELGDDFVFCVTRLESAHDVLSIAGVLNTDNDKNDDVADGGIPMNQNHKVKQKSNLKKRKASNSDTVVTTNNIKIEVMSDVDQPNMNEMTRTGINESPRKRKIKTEKKRAHEVSLEANGSEILDNDEFESPRKRKSKKAKKRRHEDRDNSDQNEDSFGSSSQKIIKQEVEEHSDEKQKKHKKHKKHKKKYE